MWGSSPPWQLAALSSLPVAGRQAAAVRSLDHRRAALLEVHFTFSGPRLADLKAARRSFDIRQKARLQRCWPGAFGQLCMHF